VKPRRRALEWVRVRCDMAGPLRRAAVLRKPPRRRAHWSDAPNRPSRGMRANRSNR